MTEKFFEFNSKFRNRNLYPNPAQFQLTVSQSGTRTQQNAFDPVSYQAPYTTIGGSAFPTSLSFTYDSPPGSSSISGMSASNILVLHSTTAVAISGAYDGCALSWTNGSAIQEQKRIVTSTYLETRSGGNIYFLMTLDEIFDNFTADTSQTLTVYTGTDVSQTGTGYMYIPFSLPIDNYLNNYVIYNDTVSISSNVASYCQITAFNGTTHIAQLSSVPASWVYASDVFSLRLQAPTITGTLVNNAVNTLVQVVNNLGTGYSSSGTNVATTGGTGTGLTVSWTGGTGGALPANITIVNHGHGYSALDVITITTGNANAEYTVTSILSYSNSTGVFILPTTLDSTYINSFIDLPSANAQTVARITSVSGNLGFVSPSTTVFSTQTYEILQFSVDNYVPFTYTGTLVSTTQPTAYDVRLVSLSLPNQSLTNGSKIGFYPYVYVEFENVSNSSAGAPNLIYSNNPYAIKAVFRVPIQQLSFPNTELYTENEGYMTQRMVFKQGDDIKLTVKLPNGNVFQTITSDFLSPLSPNDYLQVSALFSVKSIN